MTYIDLIIGQCLNKDSPFYCKQAWFLKILTSGDCSKHDFWFLGYAAKISIHLTPQTNRIITAQWEGMGDVGATRYEPAQLPPCPTIRVLCCRNCQRSYLSQPEKQYINQMHPASAPMHSNPCTTVRVANLVLLNPWGTMN